MRWFLSMSAGASVSILAAVFASLHPAYAQQSCSGVDPNDHSSLQGLICNEKSSDSFYDANSGESKRSSGKEDTTKTIRVSGRVTGGSSPDGKCDKNMAFIDLMLNSSLTSHLAGADPKALPTCESPKGKAAAAIGDNYRYGRGVAKNYYTALRWYTQAGNYDPALNAVGVIYEHGLGVPQDYTQALYWYNKAILAGNIKALRNVGLFYQYGRGVPQDYEKAAYWYNKAILGGNIDALTDLGMLYVEGRGVPQDFARACSLFRQSAEGNDEYGMYDLGGICYANGQGASRDYDKAAYWFRKAEARARENGDSETANLAAHNLAVMTQRDRGNSDIDANVEREMEREKQERDTQDTVGELRQIDRSMGNPQ